MHKFALARQIRAVPKSDIRRIFLDIAPGFLARTDEDLEPIDDASRGESEVPPSIVKRKFLKARDGFG